MKFFAIFNSDLDTEHFTAASNDQISTWLFLHSLCSKQTNSGTIQGAATMPDKFWSRQSIEKTIIDEPSPLWSWSGDDLTIFPYDLDGEELYLKKVKGGKEGGDKRWKMGENRSPNRSANRSANRSPDAPYPRVPESIREENTPLLPHGGNEPSEPNGDQMSSVTGDDAPLPFASEKFRAAWSDWEKHRSEIKKKLTPTSVAQQFKKFAEWGERRTIAAIEHTIEKGWQGLVEPTAINGFRSEKPARVVDTGPRTADVTEV
ncbi:MAG: hypothetical protein K9N23_10460 [Akkermansiaceae bacterium]|nr:hypothetical protein [Akkermansiaceae bacterium]